MAQDLHLRNEVVAFQQEVARLWRERTPRRDQGRWDEGLDFGWSGCIVTSCRVDLGRAIHHREVGIAAELEGFQKLFSFASEVDE